MKLKEISPFEIHVRESGKFHVERDGAVLVDDLNNYSQAEGWINDFKKKCFKPVEVIKLEWSPHHHTENPIMGTVTSLRHDRYDRNRAKATIKYKSAKYERTLTTTCINLWEATPKNVGIRAQVLGLQKTIGEFRERIRELHKQFEAPITDERLLILTGFKEATE